MAGPEKIPAAIISLTYKAGLPILLIIGTKFLSNQTRGLPAHFGNPAVAGIGMYQPGKRSGVQRNAVASGAADLATWEGRNGWHLPEQSQKDGR